MSGIEIKSHWVKGSDEAAKQFSTSLSSHIYPSHANCSHDSGSFRGKCQTALRDFSAHACVCVCVCIHDKAAVVSAFDYIKFLF